MAVKLIRNFSLPVEAKVGKLSKGQARQVALLCAVCHRPEVLLLDEPAGGLDPVAREEFLDGVLRTICDRGQTVLFSTHTLDDVQRLADTVGILYEGRMLVHRNIDELLTTTKRIRATLPDGSRPQRAPAGTIWQRVEGREWLVTIGDFSAEKVEQFRAQNAVDHVEVIDLGLEDLFKDFVKGQRDAS